MPPFGSHEEAPEPPRHGALLGAEGLTPRLHPPAATRLNGDSELRQYRMPVRLHTLAVRPEGPAAEPGSRAPDTVVT